MRFGRYILFIGFLLIIFSLGVLSYVSQDREKSEFENRFLAQNPEVSSQKIASGEYFKQFETYFVDQFYQRDNWVKYYTQLQMKITPVYINGYHITNDDYILAKPDEGFPQKAEDIAATNVNELGNYLANKDAKLYYFSLPSKKNMLVKSLPKYVPKGRNEANKDYFLSQLNPEVVTPVDIRPSLEENNDYEAIRKMYFKTDHHWNIKGAMLGYEKIIETISNDFDSVPNDYELSNYTLSCLKGYDFIGSWNKQLLMQVNSEGEPVCYYEPNTYSFNDFVVYKNGIKEENRVDYSSIWARIKNKATKETSYPEVYSESQSEFNIVNPSSENDLKVLVLKDSYMNPLPFYLAHHFKETTYYDMRYEPSRSVYDYLASHDFDIVMIGYNDTNLTKEMYDFKTPIK